MMSDLDALLGQILGSPVGDVSNDEPVTHGLDGAVDGHDASGALGGNVQVVGDGASGHLEDLIYDETKKAVALRLPLKQASLYRTGWSDLDIFFHNMKFALRS